ILRRCSHDGCRKGSSFNFEGSKTAAYCSQHAEEGMVNVYSKRCKNDLCARKPIFNVAG
ncbi:unnamed protein product, partial [Laminaria digitata]